MKNQPEKIFVSEPCCWAPGLCGKGDWLLWAQGKKDILKTSDSPKLEFTDALFRRRLSQISKMTIQVVHDVLESTKCAEIVRADTKQVFVSFRGEIAREFSVNKSLISDAMILPASFSLSVFNTPIALASLAFKLRGGYSVIFPSRENFAEAFKTACAPVWCGAEKQLLFVYADELVPEEYGDCRPANGEPLAFACVISEPASCQAAAGHKTVRLADITAQSEVFATPQSFLRNLIAGSPCQLLGQAGSR